MARPARPSSWASGTNPALACARARNALQRLWITPRQCQIRPPEPRPAAKAGTPAARAAHGQAGAGSVTPPARSAPGPRRTRTAWSPVGRPSRGIRSDCRPAPSRPAPPAARHRRQSWQASDIARPGCAPRTKSPLRRSAASIHRRRRPVLAPGNLAQPQRLPKPARRVAPSSTSVEPGRQRIAPPRDAASSSTPSPPIAGVGRMPVPSVSLYRLTLPLTTGKSSARCRPPPMPSDAGGELAHDLGLFAGCRNSCCR